MDARIAAVHQADGDNYHAGSKAQTTQCASYPKLNFNSQPRNCRDSRGPLYPSALAPVTQPNSDRGNAESNCHAFKQGRHIFLCAELHGLQEQERAFRRKGWPWHQKHIRQPPANSAASIAGKAPAPTGKAGLWPSRSFRAPACRPGPPLGPALRKSAHELRYA